MFKKFMASIGKGAAKVDLRLFQQVYQAGQEAKGEVIVFGGEVEQKINRIDVRLYMETKHDEGTKSHHIAVIPVTGSFTIREKEQKTIPFSYQLPYTLPLSSNAVSFYFDTHLDIEAGVDKKDYDYITIQPASNIQNIFTAFDQLGFRQKHSSGKIDQYGQEFEFYPSPSFSHQIDEVEVRFAVENSNVRLWLEIDVKSGFREREMKRELYLEEHVLQNVQSIVSLLEQTIRETIGNSGYNASHYQSPQAYQQNYNQNHSHYNERNLHNGHHSNDNHGSGMGGMIGGIAAGVVGGYLLNEAIESFTDNEEDNNNASDDNGNDDGGFFDFDFGGDEEE